MCPQNEVTSGRDWLRTTCLNFYVDAVYGYNTNKIRVYSDWTHQRQIDGVEYDALVLEQMRIHTGRAAL